MLTRALLVASIVVLTIDGVASAIIPGQAPALTISVASGAESERLRNALIAVHAYVEKRRKPLADLLRNVVTPPMPEVARIIAGSGERLAVAAKLLATVRLVAHARAEADAVAAVDIMIGQRIRERLFRWLDDHARHDPCDENDDERTVAEGLRAALGDEKPDASLIAPGACTEFIPFSHVDSPSPESNDVSIVTNATAGRVFEDARARLDPRSWPRCSTVWADTYLVDVRNDRPVFEHGTPKRKTISQPLGGGFRAEMLYERVQCDGKCSLEVLLNVSASTHADTYQLTYWFQDHLSGAPELTVDDGYIKVTKVDGGVSVESTKTIGFRGPADADMVLMLLRSIDMTAHLQRLVCCNGA